MTLLEKFKGTLVAQNVFLDENTGGKGKYFKARFLQPGLVKYSFGVCVLEKDTIDKFIHGFVGCPVIIGHKDVTSENAKELSCGNICHIWYDDLDGWYWGDGIIDNDEALELINQGYNVSCQYEITEFANNTTNALHNGNPYDKVILNGKPEHLAIVDRPRYENAMIAVNALDLTAENEDKWVTIKPNGEEHKGRHLLIKDGENVYDAMRRQWGVDVKGQQHLFNRKKYKTDTNYKEELYKKLQEHLKTVQKRQDNLEYLGVANPDELEDGDYEDITFEEWEDKQKREETKVLDKVNTGSIYKNKTWREIFEKRLNPNTTKSWWIEKVYKPGDSLLDDDIFSHYQLRSEEGRYKTRIPSELNDYIEEKFDTSEKYIYNPKKESKEEKNKYLKKGDLETDKVYKLGNLYVKPFVDDDGDLAFYDRTGAWGEGSVAQKFLKSDLKNLERAEKYDKLTDKELKFLSEKGDFKKAKNCIVQAINEIKETDMFKKLFNRKEQQMEKDEMKSLFIECLNECLQAKNEEDKKDDKEDNKEDEKDLKKEDEKEAENKCKNEVVDKRDIIRQIMAIAGKEEASEDVKTIAKLAEKLAYDKSEADDKADNEEEDEKKKEEAKNKAKNSIEEIKAMFSQTEVKKAASNYITRDDAIALGNELF